MGFATVEFLRAVVRCCRTASLLAVMFGVSVLAAQEAAAPPSSSPQDQQSPSAQDPKAQTPGKPAEEIKPPEAKREPQIVKPRPPLQRAWEILREGIADNSTEKRAKAVSALGLVTRNAEAEKAALQALKDEKADVRLAAATALGTMQASHAKAQLQSALDDDEPTVVLAAANSLMLLKDNDSAYDIYYGVLTGNMRTSKGLIKEQLKILHDKKKMAQMGIEQGVGYIPFVGFGYGIAKTVMKPDSHPVRAVAAKKLAHDPSPASAHALLIASHDRNWMVRAAALEAISERGDKSLIPRTLLSLDDEKDEVRFIAAACVAHLSSLPSKHLSASASVSNAQ